MLLSKEFHDAYLINYVSIKPRRVGRSVFDAETFGLADAPDSSIIIHHDLKLMHKKSLKIIILTNSRIALNV